MRPTETINRLADLAVALGANVQEGQVVRVSAEVGHQATVRAVAESAYRAGARFVDINLFDPFVQRARIMHATDQGLEEIPNWEVERLRELGDGGASIKLAGQAHPGVFDDLDPARVARASLPSLPQWSAMEDKVNWTVVPAPSSGWANALHPGLSAEVGLEALCDEIAYVCRLDQPDPAGAWRVRLAELAERAQKLNSLRLDSVRFVGPGTELIIGLFGGARWEHPLMVSNTGVEHVPNLPTEEVFTVPDPDRVDGCVKLTRPALVNGRLIDDVALEFRAGRIVDIEGSAGVGALRELVSKPGADRLGELALVDVTSRVGRLGRTFGVTLLDENAVSHLALGYGFPDLVPEDKRRAVNRSDIHLDFMIGSEAVDVVAVGGDSREHQLLRGGRWALG